MEDTEFVHLQSPLGVTYNIQLTKREIERIDSDPDFFQELCQKYDELYRKGYIQAVRVPDESQDIEEFEDIDDSHVNQPALFPPGDQLLKGQMEIKPEDEQYLIPLIEARPLLWDFRIPLKNRGRETIRSQWDEIIKELGVNMTIEELKAKWKSIRDSFIRARNNYRKRIPSGASVNQKLEAEKIKNRHRNYDMLEFLSNCLSEKRTSSNLETNKESLLDEPSTSRASMDRESSRPSSSVAQSRSSDVTAADEAFLDALKSLPHNNQLTPSQHFGMQIAESLDNLPRLIQTQTKIKIMQIIAEAEAEHC